MAKKKVVSSEAASTFLCNVTVRHNGDRFYKGEEIDLTPTEAAELLAAGSISLKQEAAE